MGNRSDGTALAKLRASVTDESTSLSALLRMCLLLGAETGSKQLREWAGQELRGYDSEDDLPDYRRADLPLFIDSMSGYNHVTGQQVSTFQAPAVLRDGLSTGVEFQQPIDELESLAAAGEDFIAITKPGYAEAAVLWTHELGPHQQVLQIYHRVSRVLVAGMVGRVRTTLVELVSELVAEAPTDAQLPTQGQVDRAVQVVVRGRRNVISVAQDGASVAQDGSRISLNEHSVGGRTDPAPGTGWWTLPKKAAAAWQDSGRQLAQPPSWSPTGRSDPPVWVGVRAWRRSVSTGCSSRAGTCRPADRGRRGLAASRPRSRGCRRRGRVDRLLRRPAERRARHWAQ